MLKSRVVSVWMMSSIIHRLPCDTGWANNNPFTESNWLDVVSKAAQLLFRLRSHQRETRVWTVHAPIITGAPLPPSPSLLLALSGNIWKSLSHTSVGPQPQLDCGWGSELESETSSLQDLRNHSSLLSFWLFFFFHRGVRAVDIEVYRLYSCVCVWGDVCSTAPSTEKTGDRNRSPRLKDDFHFNQSACWFSWLWALYKQNQMATPGTAWGCEALGRVMREEMYREGVCEIKILLSWSNTVNLNSDQDHCPNKRPALPCLSLRAEHSGPSKKKERKPRDKCSIISCLWLTPAQRHNIDECSQLLPVADNLQTDNSPVIPLLVRFYSCNTATDPPWLMKFTVSTARETICVSQSAEGVKDHFHARLTTC